MELSSYFNKWNLKILIFGEMKLSSPKIKRVLIFSQKSFSYITGNGTFFFFLSSKN